MILPIETRFLHPRRTLVLVPIGFAILLLVILDDAIRIGSIEVFAAILAGIAILFWVLLQKTYLRLDNDGLEYKTIFSKKNIQWHQVKRTFIRYRHHGKSGSIEWQFESSGGQHKFGFSASSFSRRDLRIIAEALVTKCGQAITDDRIIRMSEGRFPWYIF